MERPTDKMLHPASMHEYCKLAREFGFTPFDREENFDQEDFLKQWNELRRSAKKEASFQRVRENYPECLRNKKGTSRISIYEGAKAVHPLVQDITPIYNHLGCDFIMPTYAPSWGSLETMYVPPEPGMQRMQKRIVVEHLEWAQQSFGLFDILQKKQQHLDVMLLDDLDTTSDGGSIIALEDNKTHKMRLGIILSYCDPKLYNKDYCLFDSILFHELSHLLYCLAYDVESSNKIVPDIINILGHHGAFENYDGLSQTEKHEVAVYFLNEGMLSGTEYEYLFCPRKNVPEFTCLAKAFFEQIVSNLH